MDGELTSGSKLKPPPATWVSTAAAAATGHVEREAPSSGGVFHWGPSVTLQECPASFPSPTGGVGSLAPRCGAGAWGQGRRAEGDGNSVPAACRDSARPSPGSGERLEHKAIFIYDTVSGLASV